MRHIDQCCVCVCVCQKNITLSTLNTRQLSLVCDGKAINDLRVKVVIGRETRISDVNINS